MTNFEIFRLDKIASIDISGVDKVFNASETPVKLCNFIDVYKNWSISNSLYNSFMPASANATEINRFSIKKGQVAITKDSETRDDIGMATYICEDFKDVLLGYHCALITPDEEIIDGAYLNALFHANYAQRYFSNNASGSGQRYSLSIDAIKAFPVYVPKMELQKRIAKLFANIDRKIIINNAINDNLEQQTEAIFKYMFPNVSYGKKLIGDYIVPKRGQALLSKNAIAGEVPVVAGGLSPSTYHNVSNTTSPVVTISGSGANAGYVSLWNIPVWSSDSSYIDSSMTPNVFFWYCLLKTRQQEIFNLQTGSAQPHIYPKHIADLSLSNIDIQTVKLFCNIVGPLFNTIGTKQKENIQLARLRDWLLPLLMNGQATIE